MTFPQLMPFTATSSSRVLETDGEDMPNHEHSCFFCATHAAKDTGIAVELAPNLGLDLRLARATKEQCDGMIIEGLGELTNPAPPTSRSKIATNILAIAHDRSLRVL
jgi:3-hydroxyisobutyrate dehydrogenase-like beta-hydroxyacid dehydrogenase